MKYFFYIKTTVDNLKKLKTKNNYLMITDEKIHIIDEHFTVNSIGFISSTRPMFKQLEQAVQYCMQTRDVNDSVT